MSRRREMAVTYRTRWCSRPVPVHSTNPGAMSLSSWRRASSTASAAVAPVAASRRQRASAAAGSTTVTISRAASATSLTRSRTPVRSASNATASHAGPPSSVNSVSTAAATQSACTSAALDKGAAARARAVALVMERRRTVAAGGRPSSRSRRVPRRMAASCSSSESRIRTETLSPWSNRAGKPCTSWPPRSASTTRGSSPMVHVVRPLTSMLGVTLAMAARVRGRRRACKARRSLLVATGVPSASTALKVIRRWPGSRSRSQLPSGSASPPMRASRASTASTR